jgi:thymidylate kinase
LIAPSLQATDAGLLRCLFRAFDEHGIRYCVLHSYERLPELASDLDVAVHPDDYPKLGSVIRVLAGDGFPAIHCINYALGANYLVFAWFDGAAMHLVSVDTVCEHRRRGLLLASGAELTAGRRKWDGMWVSSAQVEFAYRLSKLVLKRTLDGRREERLRALVNELGDAEAVRVAATVFGESWARTVVDACRRANLSATAPQLEERLLRTAPRARLCERAAEALRLWRRWWHPTGLWVALLGPDGVGKSTLIDSIQAQPAGFRRFGVFHWRPMAIGGHQQSGPTDQPHRQTPRPAVPSMLRTLMHFADYWVGYWTKVRPLVGRTGLVVFDRYFDDVLVDPVRYRYGGPRWWLRLLRGLTPRPDLMFILDAPEEVVLARKQECAPERMRVLRSRYLALADGAGRTRVIAASEPPEAVVRQTMQSIASVLHARLERRNPKWFGEEV